MLLVNNCNPVRFPFDGYLNVYEAEPSWQVSSSQGHPYFTFILGSSWVQVGFSQVFLEFSQVLSGSLRFSQVFSGLIGILMFTRQSQAGKCSQGYPQITFTLGSSWVQVGVSQVFSGSLRFTQVHSGSLRLSQVVSGCLRLSQVLSGFFRFFQDFSGFFRVFSGLMGISMFMR